MHLSCIIWVGFPLLELRPYGFYWKWSIICRCRVFQAVCDRQVIRHVGMTWEVAIRMYCKEKNEYNFAILNSSEKWVKFLLWWDGLKGKDKCIPAKEMTSLQQITNRVYLIKNCIKSVGFSNQCLFSSSRRQVIDNMENTFSFLTSSWNS